MTSRSVTSPPTLSLRHAVNWKSQTSIAGIWARTSCLSCNSAAVTLGSIQAPTTPCSRQRSSCKPSNNDRGSKSRRLRKLPGECNLSTLHSSKDWRHHSRKAATAIICWACYKTRFAQITTSINSRRPFVSYDGLLVAWPYVCRLL